MLNVTGSMAVADRAGNMSNTWIGLGWGSCMLVSEFIMVHALPNGVGVEIMELVSTGYFTPPMPNPRGTSMLALPPPGSPPHVTYQGNGVLLAEFRRYTTPSEGETTHVPLDLTKDTNILMAYNSNPKRTPSESWKIYHGRKTPTGDRQKFLINFKSGEWKVYFGGSIESKMLHGAGMGFVFMVLNPLAVYWARYVKSVKGWNKNWMGVHISLQCCTIILAISFASYIIYFIPVITNFGPNAYFSLIYHPHSIIGLIFFTLILIQSFLGPFNRLSLLHPSLHKHRDFIRLCNHLIGLTVTFGSFVQVGLGLYTLHPLPESLPSYYNRGFYWWIVYGLLVVGWISLYAASEGIWKKKYKVRRHTWDWIVKRLEKKFGVGAVGNAKMFVKNGFTLGGVGVGYDGSGKGGWWNNEKDSAGNVENVKSLGLLKRFVNYKDGKNDGKGAFGKKISSAPNNMTVRKGPGKSGFVVVRPSVPASILET
ncbi:hypothetical protein HDU76_003985, partial [Blyttiomyces sp. JEL0837]